MNYNSSLIIPSKMKAFPHFSKAFLVGCFLTLVSFLSVNNLNAQVYIPSSGSNSIACGTNTTLCTHAGCGATYSPSVNGYTVIYSASTAVITISGYYYTEANYDYVRIYSGVGTGGSLLATYHASSSTYFSYTGSAGQTLTVQFTSDGSVQNTGLNATVSFSGACVSEMTVPSSGNNSYTVCSGNLYDYGGSAGSYGDSWNGYTVLYPSISGNMIRVSGTTAGETCCDYLYIYDGVGTGGTLLWSGVANTGTVPATTSSSGPVTVLFTSDGSVVGAGFNLAISCIAPLSLGCGNTNAGSISPSDCSPQDVNYSAGTMSYWSFVATAGYSYHFSLNSTAGVEDTYLHLYDLTGTQIASDDDGGLSTAAHLDWTCSTGGTYYISATHYSCSNLNSAGYLTYWSTYNGTYAALEAYLYPTTAWQNTAYSSGYYNYYYFSATANNTYDFSLCGSSEDTYMRLYNSTWDLQAANDDAGPHCATSAASLSWTCPTTGDYIVQVNHYSCNPFQSAGNLA